VIFYTDGVTEAFDSAGEMYNSPRLLADVGQLAGKSADAITAGLLAKVREFTGSAPQSDDIALLTMKVNGTSE
jgi:sigma-B regulation protein RsbU (phosphoserine phosphatase)